MVKKKEHVMRKCIVIFLVQLVLSCSILVPDHDFEIMRLHSSAPGSSAQDSLVVFMILRLNDIPSGKFNSIATVGSDWRVHELNLSRLGVDTLPPEIGRLGALIKCDLSNNELRSLPDSITRLSIFRKDSTLKYLPGSYSLDYTYKYSNQLTISYNRLCHVTPAVSLWIDKQFNTTKYLQADTTQQCK
jgi:hypothetical protein